MEKSAVGSENLEETFKTNLTRAGRMVAILDTWDRPVYLMLLFVVVVAAEEVQQYHLVAAALDIAWFPNNSPGLCI